MGEGAAVSFRSNAYLQTMRHQNTSRLVVTERPSCGVHACADAHSKHTRAHCTGVAELWLHAGQLSSTSHGARPLAIRIVTCQVSCSSLFLRCLRSCLVLHCVGAVARQVRVVSTSCIEWRRVQVSTPFALCFVVAVLAAGSCTRDLVVVRVSFLEWPCCHSAQPCAARPPPPKSTRAHTTSAHSIRTP